MPSFEAVRSETTEASELLISCQSDLDELLERLCRRNGLVGADAEDFRGWVRMRLLENDAAILRRFRGDSTLRTFLSVVVANLLQEYRNRLWGRWRPSAAAKRMGDLAVALETIVVRDGVPLGQAVEQMRGAGYGNLSDLEAARVLDQLPTRYRRSFTGEPELENLSAVDSADRGLWDRERAQWAQKASELLDEAIDSLDHEDQLILRLRYWEGLSIAQISRTLRLDQRPLYRRAERLLRRLKDHLESRGLRCEQVTEWIV